MVLELSLSSQEFLESSQSDHWSQDHFPAYCPALLQFWFCFLQRPCFQLDGGRCVFRNLSASETRSVPRCNPVHVYPYMFFHRLSRGRPYDGLASTAAGIQAVAETDSSHLQVQALNTLHICACTAVNAHERGLVNMGEDAEASSPKHISFLQRADVFKIKCSTRIAVIREWKLKPPPLNAHHASLSTQGSFAFYSWMSTNVWAEQHLLALFGEGCSVRWSWAQSLPWGALWLWYYLPLSPTSSKTTEQIWLIAVDY